MSYTVDFSQRQDHGGWAKYLPAISGFYTTHLGKDLADENFIPKERVPKKFELGMQGLNFLDRNHSYYNYKYGLYSAGHAERNLTKCTDREPMIHRRDRNDTVLVCDSGGFQLATGVIKMDWSKVMTPEGDPFREEILRYLEHTADWAMTLDVPAFAAEHPLSEKTGLTKFQDTLDVSIYNLHYFMKNRMPGKTKFLNVISGSSPENSKQWYEAAKLFSIPAEVAKMGYTEDRTLEGFAFAGINMRNMNCVLERLLDLRDDNLLAGKDWIHFLGIGRLDWACYLTSIERVLRKHYNPNINISFDAASPFVAAGGYALSYNYNYFGSQKLTYAMGRGLDDKGLKGTDMAMPFQGPIMERLTTGDICVMGPTDTNKNGKIGKTSWDTTSYALIMAHNVYNHIQAVQEINRLADIEYRTKTVSYTDWPRVDRKGFKGVSDFVPMNILLFNDFVNTVLDPATPDPRSIIKDYTRYLAQISFGENKASNFKRVYGDANADDLAGEGNDFNPDIEE